MKSRVLLALLVAATVVPRLQAATIVPVQAKPIIDQVQLKKSTSAEFGNIAFEITWGGCVPTLIANGLVAEGLPAPKADALAAAGITNLFAKNGAGPIRIVHQDSLKAQVQAIIDHQAFALRGTLDMVNGANEALEACGIEMETIYQETFSTGGDCLMVSQGTQGIKDIKVVYIQHWGPHVNFMIQLWKDAQADLSKVKIVWMEGITQTEAIGETVTNPPAAFMTHLLAKNEPGVACFCISPDKIALMKGSETSFLTPVPGCRDLTTTAANSEVIADVIAVPKAWSAAHPAQKDAFLASLYQAEESLRDIRSKGGASYQLVLETAAKFLFGSASSSGDVDGLLQDCRFVGYAGNFLFITGKTVGGKDNAQNHRVMSDGIQEGELALGLIKKRTLLDVGQLNFTALRQGLRYADDIAAGTQADYSQVAGMVAEMDFDDLAQAALFVTSIQYAVNETEVDMVKNAPIFAQILAQHQANRGGRFVIVGNVSQEGYLKALWGGNPSEISAAVMAANETSTERAEKFRLGLFNYAQAQNLDYDPNSFIPKGVGATIPKFPIPESRDEFIALLNSNRAKLQSDLAANRRVEYQFFPILVETDDLDSLVQ